MTRPDDIAAANAVRPDFIGFVFAENSRRHVDFSTASRLKTLLDEDIAAVGVFVDEDLKTVAALLNDGIIDMAQLHGSEDEEYISRLRGLTAKPLIKAFRVRNERAVESAAKSGADHILLDSGAGSGFAFDWNIIQGLEKPFFLAGGLDPHNVQEAITILRPYAVDVSSGIETIGIKDIKKMTDFIDAVRKADRS